MSEISSTKTERRNKRMSELKTKIKLQIQSQNDSSNAELISQSSENENSNNDILRKRKNLNRKYSNIIETQQLFNSKYQILNKIGQGTSGVVYTCKRLQTNLLYAVKIMKYDYQILSQLKQSFIFINQLEHQGIIKYKALYISNHNNKVYLVMQYFNHPDLSEYQPKDQNQIKIIAGQVLSAVNYLHINGICHRDIKPENILYDPTDKQIKLIDFNISKKIKRRKIYNEMLTPTGTPQYRAPETYRGTCYTQKIDQWATGITLYMLIAKTNPFCFSDSLKRKNHFEKDYKQNLFSEEIWCQYSEQCKDLISELLAPDHKRILARDALKHKWLALINNNNKKSKFKTLKKSTLNHQIEKYPKSKKQFNESLYKMESIDQMLSWQQIPKQKDQEMSLFNKKLIKDSLLEASNSRCFDIQSTYYDSESQDDGLNKNHACKSNKSLHQMKKIEHFEQDKLKTSNRNLSPS